MSQYQVGDVAALFGKPKEATTEAGKKLQSLFEEFHCKKSKSGFQSKKSSLLNDNLKIKENGNWENQRNSKKSKKRKFSDVSQSDSTLSVENNVNKSGDGEEMKMSKKKVKDNDSTTPIEKAFPRKKKNKFSAIESDALELQPADNSIKATKLNSGFIKKSKHKKMKDNSCNFDNANSKKANIKDSEEEDDESLKEEIKKFIESNSVKEKLGKKKKYDAKQVSPKKSFDMKTSKMKSKSSESFEMAPANKQASENVSDLNTSPAKQNQTADFIRRPKIKNKDNSNKANTTRYYDKNANNSLNGGDALFNSEHEENYVSGKKHGTKAQNSKQISSQNTSEKTELDFISLPSDSEQDDTEEHDSKQDDKERLDRTVFVGNLPLNVNKKAITKLFSSFGEIESIRCLGIETDKSKIFSKNPPKSLNPNYASETVPAFVVFAERQGAIDALSLTGTVFKDRHITVDLALPAGTKKLYDEKRSVFIGNLPFGVKEESIWNAFSECGRIEGVRLVKDRNTGIGKGFGYVLFSTLQSKENALGLKDLQIEGRSIRIKAVESNKKKHIAKEGSTKKDTFKSRAIRQKKSNKNPNSRKSVSKLMKKEKTKHNKRKVAAILQKSMK